MRAVFADCHVGRRPDDDGPFWRPLDEASPAGREGDLSLLGDVFHFFIAHPKFETPSIARFLRASQDLAARGVSITYIEGNREFFLRGSTPNPTFTKSDDTQTFEQGSVASS